MRVYSPNLFLYEAGRRYDVDASYTTGSVTNYYWPWWNAGNYIPVVYVTPIVAQKDRNNMGVDNPGGPWRVTIVVFKSRGTELFHPRLKNWNQLAYNTATGEPSYAAEAGAYIIDRNVHAGEAYKIDLVNADPNVRVNNIAGSRSDPPIYLACGLRADTTINPSQREYIKGSSTMRWYIMPGAVGAFHTIIGE
jgi:hypothetical protein